MTDAGEALHSPSAAAAANGSASRSLVRDFVQNVRELWSEHPSFVTSAAIVLLINFVLLSAYLWSRGGQTTHVRLEANGDTFSAYVDGRLMVESQFLAAPERGGIMLGIGGPRDIVPTRPYPRGIDSVRVTDLETGKVLFEDDFTDGPSAKWDVTPDVFTNDDGVLRATLRGTLTMFAPSWHNYALDVTYRNIAVGDMMVRASGADAGVFYTFRPFRHFDNALGYRAPGAGQTVAGPLLRMSSVETVKSIVAMALHPYPFALELLALGLVAVGALQFVSFKRIRLPLPAPPPDLPWLAIAVIAGSTFGVLLFLITVYGKNLPHVPDAVSYIFQAKVLASGRLSVSPPPIPEVFDFFSPPFIVRHGDKWASIYPFGHPLALAFGERVGAMWLIPPLIGASTVGLMFILGQKIYRTRVGLLAAIMLASSPFFLMTGSDFMSHNTAAFYLVTSLLFLAYIDKRPVLFGVLSGVFFGLVFNTRPLTSLALMPPFAAYLASLMAREEERPLGAQQVAAFLAGGLLMLGAYWLYNWGTTGDPFANGYQAGSHVEQGIGFGSKHSFIISTQHEQTQMALLLLVLNGWPSYVGLAFVLLPFMLGSQHRWDWFLLSCALLMMAVWVLWRGNGVMHGPRYWYETTPLLMLLAARGADRAGELLSSGAGWLKQTLLGPGDVAKWAGVAISYGLVLALVGGSIYGWLLSRETSWAVRFVPARSIELQGFNYIDERLVELVDEADLHNALVLVEVCPNWWCYGNVFWMNSPDLDGDIVYARNIPRHQAALFRAYPDRRVYIATYTVPSLTPYELPGRPTSDEEAPLAREITATLPMPTSPGPPSVNDGGSGKRDEQRLRDLTIVADALDAYYLRHQTYPLAVGLQSLCRYGDLDAGCQLGEVIDPIPQDSSPQGLYWYQSDGATFTLFAGLDGEPPNSDCPDPLPRAVRHSENLYCLRGSPPGS